MDEKGVSNNKFFRGLSDKLDNKMGWEGDRKTGSGARGIIHGAYHYGVGVGKYCTGNTEGGKAEFNRGNEQFSRGKNLGNSPSRK